jgi:outer membrane protein OmpA-like peptidoglycan-associated protein
MALPLCRSPKWSSRMAVMTSNRAIAWRSHRSPRVTVRIVAYEVFAVLVLYGCSTPQPIVPIPTSKPSPPVITAIPLPPPEEIAPPTPKEETTAPFSEENNIFFALRSAVVSDAGKEKLHQHAERLKQDRKKMVLLVGHADVQGSRSYNIAITEERLSAVEKLLRSYGVPVRQIRRNRSDSVKNSPSCTRNECRQQMRRVELVYSR